MSNSIIRIELEENEKIINVNDYTIISTGEIEEVTTNSSIPGKDDSIILTTGVVPFEELTYNYVYNVMERRLPVELYGEPTIKRAAENYFSNSTTSIKLVDVLNPHEYSDKISNIHVYGNPSIVLEGKIQSNLFEYDKTFSLYAWNDYLVVSSETFELTETQQETIPEDPIPEPEPTPEPAPELEESPVITSEPIVEEAVSLESAQEHESPTCLPDEIMLDDGTCMDPEPTPKESKCGPGTETVNGICKVIKQEKGFFEWLMSLFGTW